MDKNTLIFIIVLICFFSILISLFCSRFIKEYIRDRIQRKKLSLFRSILISKKIIIPISDDLDSNKIIKPNSDDLEYEEIKDEYKEQNIRIQELINNHNNV